MNSKYLWGVISVAVIIGAMWWFKANKTAPPTETIMDEVGIVTPTIKETSTIIYSNDGFSPTEITVRAGTEVIFINQSDSPMWVASGAHPTHLLYPEFDAKTSVPKGGTYSFTFNKIGEHPYHNHMLLGRYGKIIVE